MESVMEQNRGTKFIMKLFIPFASGFFISVLYRALPNVLAPNFISEFKLSAGDLGMMVGVYFAAFAIVQIPLGVFLDRYGARRNLTILLIIAAIGSIAFSLSTNMNHLVIGRALMGFGMAGCLMCAFKAYNEWIPAERLPLINSCHIFVGGIGAITATKPIYWMLGYMSWRGVFVATTVLAIAAALLVYFVSPRKEKEGDATESIGAQLKGVLGIAHTMAFWRLAPVAITIQATYVGLNSLWIGPWLKDVGGYAPGSVADALFISAIGLAAGMLLSGVITDRVRKYGITTAGVCLAGMTLFTATLCLIALAGKTVGIWGWAVSLFFGPFVLLSYPVFISMFDQKLTGRVITLYNLLVFVSIFGLQWIMGAIIDLWPPIGINYNPEGYKVALLGIFAINTLALAWLFVFRKTNIDFLSPKK